MPGICRISDIGTGICSLHKTPISITAILIEGESNIINEFGVSKISSTVVCSCGHSAIILSGEPNVTVNGITIAKVGSNFGAMPTGIMINGSSNVTV